MIDHLEDAINYLTKPMYTEGQIYRTPEGYLKYSDGTLEECEAPAVEDHDAVNHPSHYRTGKYECIDVIEDWNLSFHEANAVKYICRAEHKGKEIEDLKKARWYLDRAIALREKEMEG